MSTFNSTRTNEPLATVTFDRNGNVNLSSANVHGNMQLDSALTSAAIRPSADAVYDIGASTARYRATYTGEIIDKQSAKYYGAIGDGVVDDTAALQIWADYIAANNVDGRLPAGTYKISSTLTFKNTEPGRVLDLTGAVITMTPSSTSVAVQFGTDAAIFSGHVIGGLISASTRDTTNASCGIKLYNIAESLFNSVKVKYFYYNWYVNPSALGRVAYSSFLNICAQDCGHTNLLLDNANGGIGYHGELNFFGGRMRISGSLSFQQHISITGDSNHNRFIGVSCEGNGLGQTAIYINNASNTISNCRVETPVAWLSGAAITLDTSAARNIIIDNRGDMTIVDNGTQNQLFSYHTFNLGASTLSINRSTGVGFDALVNNTSGAGCVGVGEESLHGNSSGSFNTATGRRSLYRNTTGIDNSAFGYIALNTNQTANGCSAFGSQALTACIGASNSGFGRNSSAAVTTGTNNCSFGWNSMLVASTGSSNCAYGASALVATTTTNNNCAFGQGAGATPTAPVNCIFIGHAANSSVNGITNAIVIGDSATTTTNNSCTVGNASVNKLIMGGGLVSAADDAAAATASVPVGGLYHTSGAVKIRLT